MAFDVKISDGIRGINVDGDTPLPRVSRDVLAMTGTKFGCGKGPCGARAMHVDGVATRFCLTTIVNIGTSEITTIEAIGETMPGARIQQAWFDREVVQCGNCQPGQIMSASALLSLNSQPTDADTDDAMAGNVRRCGTYARIREAIRHVALLTGRGTAGDPRDKRPVPARVAATGAAAGGGLLLSLSLPPGMLVPNPMIPGGAPPSLSMLSSVLATMGRSCPPGRRVAGG